MKTHRWTGAGLLAALTVGLVLGMMLTKLPPGLSQPATEGPEAQLRAQLDEAARDRLAAEEAAMGLPQQQMVLGMKIAELSTPAVMEIHEPFVFVVKGRGLYQFDLQSLELLHWAALKSPKEWREKALLEQKMAEDQAAQAE